MVIIMKQLKKRAKGQALYKKSIKSSIITIMLSSIIGVSLILGILCSILNFTSSIDVLDQTMTELAKVSAERINTEITEYKNILSFLAVSNELIDINTTASDLENLFQTYESQYDLKKLFFANTEGLCKNSSFNISNEEYFKQAIQGNFYISSPAANTLSEDIVMVLSAPVYSNDHTIIGVLAAIPDDTFIHNIVKSIDVGKRGGAYIIDGTGTILSDLEESRIGTINMIELAKTDPTKKKQAEIEKKMIAGESSIGKLTSYKGTTELVAYAPILESNHWSIGIYATQNDFLGGFVTSIFITFFLIVIFAVLSCFFSIRFATRLSKPIEMCTNRLVALADGDLTTPAPQIYQERELYLLSNATTKIVSDLNTVIRDEIHVLHCMEQGDFTHYPSACYPGDYQPLKESISAILNTMKKTLTTIEQTAIQVASSCNHFSEGAQSLSEGSISQSETVDSLVQTFSNIYVQIANNAQNALQANEQTSEINDYIKDSMKQMEFMTTSMQKIEETSAKIIEIVKTIEEFASETNLLSLNAAIEAARAGEAGRGFAVVASSIRTLAEKSAQAVKETNELISATIEAVKTGSTIADYSAQSIQKISNNVSQTVNLIESISESTSNQASSIEYVSSEIETISSVIQDNSHTAQKNAQASEKMAAQAETLRQLMNQFQV